MCSFSTSARFLTFLHRLSESSKAQEVSAPSEPTKLTVNQQHLKQAWDVSQVQSREDWIEWMHRLSVEFMKESSSHALRACMSLVEVHPPLAKELFNAAFISCWGELYDQYQVRKLDVILRCVWQLSTGGSRARHRFCHNIAFGTLRSCASSPESSRIYGT